MNPTTTTIQGKPNVAGRKVDVSGTVYADDVKEIKMATGCEQAVKAQRASMKMLNDYINRLSMRQNLEKRNMFQHS